MTPGKIFAGLTFGVHEGDRLGIVGPNGAGKSTLLKILAGIETPDEGQVTAKRNLRWPMLPQEVSFSGRHHAGIRTD